MERSGNPDLGKPKRIERGSNGFNGLKRIFFDKKKLIRSNRFDQLNPRSMKSLFIGQEMNYLSTNYPVN